MRRINYSMLAYSVALIILGLIVGLYINIDKQILESIILALATLLAAFSGAWLAFRLENKREDELQVNCNVDSANRAIYTIYRLWNILRQYQKEVLDPMRGRSDMWVGLKATPATSFKRISFDGELLTFLLRTEYANMYARLLQEEQRFDLILQLITRRTEITLGELHPKMEAMGIKPYDEIDLTLLELNIGPRLTTQLKSVTSEIEEFVDDTASSLRKLYGDFLEAVKEIYPEQKFISIEFTE